MAFDPSVISSISDSQFDPIASQQKAAGVKNALDTTQLNSLQLGEEKRQVGEQDQVREILKNSKYDTPQGLAETAAKVNRVSPKASMDLLKQGQSYQSGQVQAQMDQLQLAGARQDLIVSAIDPIVAQARQMKSKGASDLEVKAFITQQMPQALQSLRSQTLGDGKPALPDEVLKMATEAPRDLATLESWEMKSKQGASMIKQRLEQHKQDTVDQKESESERHNRALESNATARTDLAKDKIQKDSEGGLTPDSVNFVAERYLAGDTSVMQGLSKGDRAKIQNRTKDIAEIAGLTGKDAAANRAEFTGLMAGERTLAQRQANIDTATQEFKNVAPNVLEAARDLPRAAFVPWNQLTQIWERGTSDPKLAKFAQGARTLANLYTRATVPGASSVSDRESALHDLPTYTDEKSFEATVDFMLKEINAAQASPRDVRADMRANVTGKQSPGAGAGPQGASPPAGPAPVPGGPAPAGAAPAPPKAGAMQFKPGQTYKHSSGATIEIIG